MADFISLAKPLQLTTPGTAPIAGLVVQNTAALQAIGSPWLGMIVYVEADGKSYRVTKLKDQGAGGAFSTKAVEAWEEVGASVDLSSLDGKYAPKEHSHEGKYAPLTDGKIPGDCIPEQAKPATITLPIPYDADLNNIALVVDFSPDGNFSGEPGGKFTRVEMSKFYSKMRLFSNGKWIACPSASLGLAYYGGSIAFTLDTELVPNYQPGTKYFARYCWVDEYGEPADWKGFVFTGDVSDFVPVRTGLTDEPKIKNLTDQSSTIELNYQEAEIFNIELSGNLQITTASVKNLVRGEMMIAHLKTNGHKVTAGTTEYSPSNNSMVVGFVNLGNEISIICAETVN